ncbi:hypothetical protein [Faunimonas sp. B44]|uniref:hypothetical protein n=1 Tax=Faunimonas sp. B44 TaxID=3461493 RepID=UPI0040443BAB
MHSGLTVELIATPRAELMTCRPEETVASVIARNVEGYDFLPVVEQPPGQAERIVGLFHATTSFESDDACTIAEHFLPLSEEYVIGADGSILDFVWDADEKPCRLVISGARVVGLVSLSDLQKLPVRAALFALITGLEITMAETIRRVHAADQGWMPFLSEGRIAKVKRQIAASRKDDGFVDSLLFTQFCDKADIVVKSSMLPLSRSQAREQLEAIQELRNSLAHANDYAAVPEQARNVCAVVRNLISLKAQIAAVPAPAPQQAIESAPGPIELQAYGRATS